MIDQVERPIADRKAYLESLENGSLAGIGKLSQNQLKQLRRKAPTAYALMEANRVTNRKA